MTELQKTDSKGMLVPLPTWSGMPCLYCFAAASQGIIRVGCETCEGKKAVKVNLDELKEWRPQ